MRGDDAVGVEACRWRRNCGRVVVVRVIAVGVPTDRGNTVLTVLTVLACWVTGRRRAPVAVLCLEQAVLNLGSDIARMVDAPALWPPRGFRHEQRHHERLEHASALTRHDVHHAMWPICD